MIFQPAINAAPLLVSEAVQASTHAVEPVAIHVEVQVATHAAEPAVIRVGEPDEVPVPVAIPGAAEGATPAVAAAQDAIPVAVESPRVGAQPVATRYSAVPVCSVVPAGLAWFEVR